MKDYSQPIVSFLILDYNKPKETEVLLASLKARVKFPHEIIYLHNGSSDYAYDLYKRGAIDKFIQTKENNGLGIGTRDLFAACFSHWAIYVQNDQYLGRDFTADEFNEIVRIFFFNKKLNGLDDSNARLVGSISLAGAPCGQGVYSERAHLINTSFYKHMEMMIPLPNGGAGPYHHQEWREGAIQKYYKEKNIEHYIYSSPLFVDNGRTAERQNPDGSRWRHYPDTKQLFLLSGPVKEKYIYPKFTDEEWAEVISTQNWPDGKIPSCEVNDSFSFWNKL